MNRGKRILTCPQCGGPNLYYEAGLVTGYKYHCKDCDYVGAFVVEKEIPVEYEENTNEEANP